MPPPNPHLLSSQPSVMAVLDRLHDASLAQEGKTEDTTRGSHFPKNMNDPNDKSAFEHQLVALDKDKCEAIFLTLRAMGATRVIEAGTSYGVSLLWLLAAVKANVESKVTSNHPPLVIGTEYEPVKAKIALSHVDEAFSTTPPFLNLLQGDLLKTLPAANFEDKSIDALLLDIWSELSLPTLKILLPKLRKGAVVWVDNSIASAERYEELLTFLRGDHGFVCTTLPFSGGLEMCVYVH